MKKIRLFPVFISILFILNGCSAKKEKLYQGTMVIPENGIVEKAVFEQIKNDSGVVTFTGNSNGCDYEWVIFGDAVPEPKDMDLSVEINEEHEEKAVNIRFSSQENFGFSPMLSIHINSLWNYPQAIVYDENDEIICRAYITENESSIINFSVSNSVGKYIIRAGSERKTEISKAETENIKTEIKTQTASATEKKSEITTVKSENIVPETSKEHVSVQKNNTVRNSYSGDNVISNGTTDNQGKHKTESVTTGRSVTSKTEKTETDTQKTHTCTFLIECSAIFSNLSDLNAGKLDVLPENGVILPACEVEFHEGESVYDVLQRVCKDNNIHLESSWTPVYNSAYIEGIGNLYEFDCGNLSGWMYRVNGWYPNYGCSRYQLKDGEVVEWRYTCSLGSDVGGGSAVD